MSDLTEAEIRRIAREEHEKAEQPTLGFGSERTQRERMAKHLGVIRTNEVQTRERVITIRDGGAGAERAEQRQVQLVQTLVRSIHDYARRADVEDRVAESTTNPRLARVCRANAAMLRCWSEDGKQALRKRVGVGGAEKLLAMPQVDLNRPWIDRRERVTVTL